MKLGIAYMTCRGLPNFRQRLLRWFFLFLGFTLGAICAHLRQQAKDLPQQLQHFKAAYIRVAPARHSLFVGAPHRQSQPALRALTKSDALANGT